MRIRTILRFALRDLRGGVSGLRVLIACIALGVFAIVAVNALSAALQGAIAGQGRTLLGGDLSFSRMHRDLNAEERTYLSSKGALTTIAVARAMARSASGEAALVELKAVPDGWPRFGEVALDPAIPVADAISGAEGVDGAVAEQALFDRLGLKIGDEILVGDSHFRLRAALRSEPDRLALGVGFGPRVLVSFSALAATGLTGDDALVRYVTRVTLDRPAPAAGLDALLAEAKTRLPDAGFETRTRDNVSPDFSRNIDRFAEYLTLVGLFSLIVGGAGVALAARGFVERKRAGLAVLKCLGATGGEAAAVLIAEFLMVAAAGVVIGVVLGEAAPFGLARVLAPLLPVPLEPALDARAASLGALYGLAAALAFALPALGRAHAQKPMATFRGALADDVERAPARYWIGAGAGFLMMTLTATLASPQRIVAVVAIAATLAAMIALWAVGIGLKHLAPRLKGGGFAWRMALANVGRRGSSAPAVLMALGLGFAVLTALALIDSNLRAQLIRVAAGETPSFYFLDVRSSDADRFRAFLNANAPGGRIVEVPMLRGRITKVNGVPAEQIKAPDSASWALDGDRGITFSEAPPKNATLTEGVWWNAGYAGPPLVSFEAEVAKGLGLKIGDSVEVNVLGRPVAAKIANFRKVDWRSFAINFVMVFSPDAFKGAPYSDLVGLAFEGRPPDDSKLTRAVAQAFPTVVTIPVREAIATIDGLVANLALAIRLSSLLALFAAVFVLAGALAADRRARAREGAILKTLGATRGFMIGAAAREYAFIGGASALVGALVGSAVAFVVVRALFGFDFVFPVASVVLVLAVGPTLTLFFGLFGTWRALSAKPAQILRDL